MILLGSIQRYELERILLIQLSPEPRNHGVKSLLSNLIHNMAPVATVSVVSEDTATRLPEGKGEGGDGETRHRFQVTRVDQTEEEKMKEGGHGGSTDAHVPMQLLSVVRFDFFLQFYFFHHFGSICVFVFAVINQAQCIM